MHRLPSKRQISLWKDDDMQESVDLSQLPKVLGLLQNYEKILNELMQLGVSRTYDAPNGQYAEGLAEQRLNGTRATLSEKSYDLSCEEFGKVQVKARIARGHGKRGETQLSAFRSFDFCHGLVLIFEPNYTVRSATILRAADLKAAGRQGTHVNATIIHATPELLKLGTDITSRFQ